MSRSADVSGRSVRDSGCCPGFGRGRGPGRGRVPGTGQIPDGVPIRGRIRPICPGSGVLSGIRDGDGTRRGLRVVSRSAGGVPFCGWCPVLRTYPAVLSGMRGVVRDSGWGRGRDEARAGGGSRGRVRSRTVSRSADVSGRSVRESARRPRIGRGRDEARSAGGVPVCGWCPVPRTYPAVLSGIRGVVRDSGRGRGGDEARAGGGSRGRVRSRTVSRSADVSGRSVRESARRPRIGTRIRIRRVQTRARRSLRRILPELDFGI